MKKKLMMLVLAVLAVISMVGCQQVSTVTGIEIPEDMLPMYFEQNENWTVEGWDILLRHTDETTSRRIVSKSMITGLSTATLGQFIMTITYGEFTVDVPYMVVEEKYPVVTFNAGENVEIPAQSDFYGFIAVEPEFDIPEGFYFLGWYLDGELYDFNTPVTNSITLVARYVSVLDALKAEYLGMAEDYLNALNPYDYTVSDYAEITEAYGETVETIEVATVQENVLAAYDAFVEFVESKVTYSSILEAYMENFSAENYFAEDWATLQEIYEVAMQALKEYQGGAPSQDTIIAQAKVAMDKVLTMEEDIVVAENEKSVKLRDLENYFDGLVEIEYAPENWENVCELFENAQVAINEAVGTRAVAAAYANALDEIAAVAKLDEVILAKMNEVVACYEDLLLNEYFEEDLAVLQEIYEKAIMNLRLYKGGAPTPENIAATAIEAMGAVNTKAEDIALAENEKAIKLRDLKNFVDGLDELNYSPKAWEQVVSGYNNGVNAINEAVGTRAVAVAYANVVDSIKAIEELSDEIKAAVAELVEYYKDIIAVEYFEEDIASIDKIYEEALFNLRSYNGGAPNLDTILAQAKDAMDKVPTKAEDIALAENEKALKLRDLNNTFNSYVEFEYTTEAWNALVAWNANAQEAINNAVGTRAVAAAYADAMANIPVMNKIAVELTQSANEFKAYFEETYVVADYFEDQWTELNAIYASTIESIRDYIGGAPSIETIVSQAKESLDKVVTKAEDIELAKNEKTIKIRDLNNFVASLDQTQYSEENWNNIQKALSDGIDAINAAEGTKAVAEAYAAALEKLQELSKMTIGD